MAKKVTLRDKNANQLIPVTRSTAVEMNDGMTVQEKFDALASGQTLSFYTDDTCSINIYERDDTLNGDYSEQTPIETKSFTGNTQVSVQIYDNQHFEIVNPNDSIKVIYNWPRTCDKFYDWFMGVSMFCNMIFNFNKMNHSAWEHSTSIGSQYKFGVVEAQYRNCIFWWDAALTDANVHCYMLHKTQECPLFYSSIPANTYKILVEPYNVTVNPNWTNPDFIDSFEQALGNVAFSYTQYKSVPFASALDADVVTNIITLPASCVGLFYCSLAQDTATFDCTNVTTFGYNQSSWRRAFYACYELRHLMLKNLKVSIDVSWSPISNHSLNYIISNAANVSAIDIKLSAYTWYNLTDTIRTAATNKNINLILGSTSNNVDLKIWNDVEGIKNSYLSSDNLDLSSYVSKTELSAAGYLTSHQDLTSYVNTSYYDVDTKKIYLSHGDDVISEIDTTEFSVETSVEIEYNDLVDLRDNSELVPGTWYRITDYHTTTSQSNIQSADHQFDIIVLATSENTLSEEAKAIQHEGDTYFENSDLNAWKVWYCLDNDKIRFLWADINTDDTTLGHITVYKNNKSWQCDRNSSSDRNNLFYWGNIMYDYWTSSETPQAGDTLYNSQGQDSGDVVESFTPYHEGTNLPNGRGVIYRLIDEWNNDCPYDFKNIQFVRPLTNGVYDENGTNTWCYTFSIYSANSISDYSITDISNKCHDNKISDYNASGYLELPSNVFINTSNSDKCCGNVFGNDCYNNTFGTNCYNNNFGNGFSASITGSTFAANTFKNVNTQLTFGNNCYNNIFGNNCGGHEFGNNCQCNIFGNYCSAGSFGNNFQYNIFGDYCTMSSFGNDCQYNTISKYCVAISFANYCKYNIIGDYCSRNNLAKDYTRYVIIESGNIWTTLTSSETTSSSNYLQNIRICAGVNNSSTAKTITHSTLGDNFQTFYRNNEQGTTESGIVALKSDLTNIDLTSYVTKSELNTAAYLTSFTETDPIYSASVAAGITASDISNWNSKTDNVGTITGITMNGASKGTSGVVDLGTVLTSHQSLTSYATSANYDSSAKKIYLKHDTTVLSEIDATDFIKDGMVDTAYVQDANLVISFNTDAGKEAVNVPIANIFNANNYYTKTEIDNAAYLQSETQLSKGTTTGSGNAVTDISVSNHQITLTKGKTFLESFTETDPIYSASAAAGITSSDITNWNSKTNNTGTITGITMNGVSKGTAGVVDLGTVVTSYIETDPVFSASAAAGITSSDISNWNSKTSNVGTITGITMNGASKGTSGVVNLGTVITSETDPVYSASAAAGITTSDITNWNNKLSSFIEADPIYSASVAAGITSTDITNWNAKLTKAQADGYYVSYAYVGSLADLTTAELNSIFS